MTPHGARSIWADWMGDAPAAGRATTRLVRGVLDAIAVDHPRAEELLDFCRAENGRIEAFVARARPHRPGRRADADHLDARLPARLRRRDADPARAAGPRPGELLRHHADHRRLAGGAVGVVPARGQRPDAAAAHHPRGGARPLPAARLLEPRADRWCAASSVRRLRRGLGGVRHPGDDGRRLRRR